MVVTASRVAQPLDRTIAHTTVLNEQAIRQSGAADVETLLRSEAGVEVTQSGGLGRQSSVFNPNRNGYDNTAFNAQLNHAFNADHQ